MDYFLLSTYMSLAILLKARAVYIALASFVAMYLSFYLDIEPYMLHAIYCLCAFPLAISSTSLFIKVSSLVFILFQYRMILDCISNTGIESTLYSYYPYISFALHLLIILSLIHRGLINGVGNTRINDFSRWLSHSKLNFSHQKTNTGR